MASPKMKIESRSGVGSNKVNRLRASNLIPGVIYKRGADTQHIQVDDREFRRVFRMAGMTSIIDLELDGEKHSVVVKEIQKHPIKDEFLHVDFQELDMDETIRVTIPINLMNRDSIEIQPSVLTQLLSEIEIECLPQDIPNSADVDVSDIDFATPKFVEDLDVASDDKVTILTELDTAVCTLSEPSYDEEEEEALEEALVEDAADVPLVSDDEDDEYEEDVE